MPLRNLATMTGGKVSDKTINRFVHLINGEYLKAVKGAKAASL